MRNVDYASKIKSVPTWETHTLVFGCGTGHTMTISFSRGHVPNGTYVKRKKLRFRRYVKMFERRRPKD